MNGWMQRKSGLYARDILGKRIVPADQPASYGFTHQPSLSSVILTTPGLLGYWPGNTDRDNTVILDYGPYTIHLVDTDSNKVSKISPHTRSTADSVRAMKFTGSLNRYSNSADNPALRTQNALGHSWEAIIHPNSSNLEVIFIKGGSSGGNTRLYWLINSDRTIWRWDTFSSSSAISATIPTHVFYRYLPTTSSTTGTEEWWFNGKRVNQVSQSIPSDDSSNILTLGGLSGGSFPLSADISHIALYKRALTVDEIKQRAVASGYFNR